jgi:hypothetical protein
LVSPETQKKWTPKAISDDALKAAKAGVLQWGGHQFLGGHLSFEIVPKGFKPFAWNERDATGVTNESPAIIHKLTAPTTRYYGGTSLL